MRILILGLNFQPEPVSTGKYTGELARYLSAAGHEVRVITAPPYYPQWKIQNGYRGWQYRTEVWRGIQIQRCPVWVPRRPTGLTRLMHLASFALSSIPSLISQLGWKPSLILCIAPTFMNAPFALLFARLTGAKAWLHIQDFELEAAVKLGMMPGGQSLAGILELFERAIMNGFHRLSTISKRMIERLHKKGVPSRKTCLFPNWVDTNLIYPMLEESLFRASFGLDSEKIIILYAGTMGKKQGMENLIAAARTLRDRTDIQFILCGDGAVRAELETLSDGLPNVRFLPVQPFEKLNQLLNLADIHILLQKADAADLVMPSKLSGMLASGRAVIATANPETELGRVVAQVGVLVPPENVDALTGAILELAASRDQRIELGKKGRDFALTHWDSELILAQFEKDLRDLTGGE